MAEYNPTEFWKTLDTLKKMKHIDHHNQIIYHPMNGIHI